jgi:hypothetical protein
VGKSPAFLLLFYLHHQKMEERNGSITSRMGNPDDVSGHAPNVLGYAPNSTIKRTYTSP